MLQEAAKAASDAWTPERVIEVQCAPSGIVIEGRVLNRDEKREYRAGRLATWVSIDTMTGNWLLELIEQVKGELARNAGRTLYSPVPA